MITEIVNKEMLSDLSLQDLEDYFYKSCTQMFEEFDLSECRTFLWEYFQAWVLSSSEANDEYVNGITRCLFYTFIDKMVESAYYLHVEKKNTSNTVV